MLSQQTDYLQIDIVGYTPVRDTGTRREINTGPLANAEEAFKTIETRSIASSPGDRKNSNKQSKRTILLPIPSNISDTNAIDYQSSNLNSIAGAAIGGVMDVMESGKNFANMNVTDALMATKAEVKGAVSSINAAVGGGEQVRGFITRFLASKAVGIAGINITPNQILARSEGQIMNPNMELLFNGPSLRSFRFQFKLTPRGETEADEIKKIIRTFKEHMAPKVSANGTFLKTPDIFELRYRKGNGEHPFLNKFKQCFLSTVNVNYTGEGTYATYHDGTPVSMIMDLSFQEIEPIYDTDYDEYKVGSGVGY